MPGRRHLPECSARQGLPAAARLLGVLAALAGCVPAAQPGEPADARGPAARPVPAAEAAAELPQIAAPRPSEESPGAADAVPPETVSVALAGRPFFCAPLQPPPGPAPFCTRSIGAVDCWIRPPLATPPLRGLADGRSTLTARQEARRNQCWPGLL